MAFCSNASAQPAPQVAVPAEQDPLAEDAEAKQEERPLPQLVEVQPGADDLQIAQRLEQILQATKWFRQPRARVDNGVVFLAGRTSDEKFKKWAGDLARNTRDVVAVVNRINVDPPPLWDSSHVRSQLSAIGRSTVRAIPLLVFAVVVLTTAWLATGSLSRFLQRRLATRLTSQLLRKTAARAVAVTVFFLALYLVLQVAGLTRMALTLAGGTGILGLALGIAFKDITENFLASIYLSIQKPFEIADLVQIDGTLGYVQRVTARTTILMALDGNHVQIPNAIVFKNSLRNFTSNPNRRVDFLVAIGYNDPVGKAQDVVAQVLRDHAAVLQDPEPWVLVDSLGASSVNLRVYFWLDGRQHSWLKVQSSVIRRTKGALQDAGFWLPGQPPVPPHPHDSDGRPNVEGEMRLPARSEPELSATEGNLSSDAEDIQAQARASRLPEQGDNLLSREPLPAATAHSPDETP
ncbi:MAG TPA: mechanosensitive ion channel family protein [Lacipirellulaceae bacterium]|mgnify:CR=1 FL=1|nr:mechanosensitive ion channel family protein [Lacipirellulaceae bacterium]HMP04849.1 mechanosensitive ion channel family protein [Lacipirellulaceae bacterium]